MPGGPRSCSIAPRGTACSLNNNNMSPIASRARGGGAEGGGGGGEGLDSVPGEQGGLGMLGGGAGGAPACGARELELVRVEGGGEEPAARPPPEGMASAAT